MKYLIMLTLTTGFFCSPCYLSCDSGSKQDSFVPFFKPRHDLETLIKMAREGKTAEEKHIAVSDLGLIQDRKAMETLVWVVINEKDEHLKKRAKIVLLALFGTGTDHRETDPLDWWRAHEKSLDITKLDYVMGEFVYGQIGYPRGWKGQEHYPHDVDLPPLYANTKTYKVVGDEEQGLIKQNEENWIKRRRSINELLRFLKNGSDLERHIAASDLMLIRSPEVIQALFDAEEREKDKHVLWHLRVAINAQLRLFRDGGDNIERAKKWWKSGEKQLADLFDYKKLPHDRIRDFTFRDAYNGCYCFAYPGCENKEYPKENFVDPVPQMDH